MVESSTYRFPVRQEPWMVTKSRELTLGRNFACQSFKGSTGCFFLDHGLDIEMQTNIDKKSIVETEDKSCTFSDFSM